MRARPSGEQGFMLIGVIVACFLLLLVLSVAAPTVAHELRREKEVEAVHRGNQYVRAIQLYYRKFGHYPTSVDQLEKSNNIRFLRQKYVNPLTGKDDWRLIHVGEAKTTVKGFFGQPLGGLPGAAAGGTGSPVGSPMGGNSTTGTGTDSTSGTGSSGLGTTSSGTGGSSAIGSGGSSGSSSFGGSSGIGGSSSFGSSSFGSSSGVGGSSSSFGGSSSSSSNSSNSTSSTGSNAGGGLMMGVGISKPGDSIVDPNQQTTYATWEFIYDPRIEQLKANAALQGAGPTSGAGGSPSGSSFGNTSATFGSSPGTLGTTAPGSTTPGSTSPGAGGSSPQQ